MKMALATLAAFSLVATPIYAANAAPAKTTTTTKASTSVAKQAKSEGESVKTEAKEVRHHAAKHKYGKYRRCGPSHMASNHHKTMHHHKAAAKTATKKG